MPEPEPTPAAEPTPDPAQDPTPEPTPAPPAFAPITSQDDFDRRVRDRLNRQKAQFDGFETFKEKAGKYDELEAASKTELEKAQAQVKKLEREAGDARKRATENALRAAVVAEAARKNVIDPDAAFALLDRTTLELDDTGSPTNIADAMDALLTAKPYLVQQAGRTPSADLGARGKTGVEQLSREALKTMSQPEILQAQKEGRLDDVLGRAR